MITEHSFQSFKNRLTPSDRMPLVFLGHGSPMNIVEVTEYTQTWSALGQTLPRPQAIVVISAHWTTRGTTLVDVSAIPRTIHDFHGFPRELYEQQYPAAGAPDLAAEVITMLAGHHAEGDDTWGLDHGAWMVLKFLYPDADVPVFQLSIDMDKDMDWQLEIGRSLASLRDRGVLILGSGNVVHNLQAMQQGVRPHEWAEAFDTDFTARLQDRDLMALADRSRMGTQLQQAHPTVEHYLPALTVAGASDTRDTLSFMNVGIDLGSVSMRSFVFHS